MLQIRNRKLLHIILTDWDRVTDWHRLRQSDRLSSTYGCTDLTQIETDWTTPTDAQMRHRLDRFKRKQIGPQIHRFTVHLRVHRFDADCTDSSRDRLTHRFTDSAWTRGCTGLKQIQVHLTDSRVSKKNTDFVKPVTDDRCIENKTDSLNLSNVANHIKKTRNY